MKRAFKYDVAVSAADFDVVAVAELKRRLEQRLSKPVFTVPRTPEGERNSTVAATIDRAIQKDARVVVVLHQRLWGLTEATETEAAAVRARTGKVKRKDVLVIPLDASPIPSWLKGVVIRGAESPTCDQMLDEIVEAVVAAGGTRKRVTEAALAAAAADDAERARARTSFLTSQRALTLINRELDSLSTAVLRLCETPGTLPDGVAAEARRTPDRYTVQIGPVGLSFSWIRGRTNSIADGQLLVIEWNGNLGERHAPADPRTATPTLEHVLRPHATSAEDWQWRRADMGICRYTTRDLAEQCVASVVRRLPPAVQS